jgi:hypothetical protein
MQPTVELLAEIFQSVPQNDQIDTIVIPYQNYVEIAAMAAKGFVNIKPSFDLTMRIAAIHRRDNGK